MRLFCRLLSSRLSSFIVIFHAQTWSSTTVQPQVPETKQTKPLYKVHLYHSMWRGYNGYPDHTWDGQECVRCPQIEKHCLSDTRCSLSGCPPANQGNLIVPTEIQTRLQTYKRHNEQLPVIAMLQEGPRDWDCVHTRTAKSEQFASFASFRWLSVSSNFFCEL